MDPLLASVVVQSQAQTQAKIQDQVGVAMLKKTVDIMAQQGADMVQLISQQAGVGQQVDLQT
jgi:Putative motility protein